MQLLQNLAIFSTLTEEELSLLAGHGKYQNFKAGSTIFKEKDSSGSLYVIASGEVKIVHLLYDDQENLLARFVAGEIFGEQELFENKLRTATAIAATPAKLLFFPDGESSLPVLLGKNPVIFSKIYQNLLSVNAGRIRKTNKLISEKSGWIAELKQQMLVDKLTGLYNRSFLEEEFAGGSEDFGDNFCLVAIKPDKFKLINDNYGHQAGDGLLVLIAEALQSIISKNDLPVRYRGNEYIVVFPQTRLAGVQQKINVFLKRARQLDLTPLTGGDPFELSFSIGVAACPEHGTDRPTLIRLAFAKMFELWNLGGNGVMIVDQSLEQSLDFLKSVEIFSSLSLYELQTIYGYLNSMTVTAGHILCREGASDEDLFIIKSGKVSIRIRLQDAEEKEVACFSAGDFFGEMALFEDAPRSATAVALEESEILVFYKKDFLIFQQAVPDIALSVMQKMLNITSNRLGNTSHFLSDMVRWGDEASKRAITDDLTGIYNRRYLETALDEKFARARRNSRPLAVVMGDLDFFREVNDGYGREIGDKYIIEVTKVFKEYLQEGDVAARYGGDEFVLLFPERDSQAAFKRCEQIRIGVSRLDFLKDYPGPDFKLAISLGLAVFPEDTDNLKSLRELADKALYAAKEGGRNRVILAGSLKE